MKNKLKKVVYLIQDINNFKIGYTTNIFNRRQHYLTHNPSAQIIHYVEVKDKKVEKNIHYDLLKKGYKRSHRKEWFSGELSVIAFREIVEKNNSK